MNRSQDCLALTMKDAALPANGVLRFLEADWPLIGGRFSVDGVHVL